MVGLLVRCAIIENVVAAVLSVCLESYVQSTGWAFLSCVLRMVGFYSEGLAIT